MLRSIGKQSAESVDVSPEEEKVSYGRKDLKKRKVLSLEWKSEGWKWWVDGTDGGSATQRTGRGRIGEISVSLMEACKM